MVWECPICLSLKSELKQYNKNYQCFSYERKSGIKNVLKQIKKLDNEPYIITFKEVKQGTKSNMGFAHGLNTVNGQFRVDFNGTRQKVK